MSKRNINSGAQRRKQLSPKKWAKYWEEERNWRKRKERQKQAKATKANRRKSVREKRWKELWETRGLDYE